MMEVIGFLLTSVSSVKVMGPWITMVHMVTMWSPHMMLGLRLGLRFADGAGEKCTVNQCLRVPAPAV